MAGHGDFEEVDEIKNPDCYMLRNGRWVTMSEPIKPDRQILGNVHSGFGLSAGCGFCGDNMDILTVTTASCYCDIQIDKNAEYTVLMGSTYGREQYIFRRRI